LWSNEGNTIFKLLKLVDTSTSNLPNTILREELIIENCKIKKIIFKNNFNKIESIIKKFRELPNKDKNEELNKKYFIYCSML